MDPSAELGAFLRECRRRVRPEEVGLAPPGPRRLPGLRREEVAAISGVGATWYARLEQGRARGVSASVLDAVARTLGLNQAEWTHLRTLAGLLAPPSERLQSDVSVQSVLVALDPSPALAIDRLWNIVGWNDAHRRVLIDLAGIPERERNLLRLVIAHPRVKALMGDWDTEVPVLVAEYRADVAALCDDPAHVSLVDELSELDRDFERWWSERRVSTFRARIRTFRRPDGTTFRLEHQRLQLVAAPFLRIITYLPLSSS